MRIFFQITLLALIGNISMAQSAQDQVNSIEKIRATNCDSAAQVGESYRDNISESGLLNKLEYQIGLSHYCAGNHDKALLSYQKAVDGFILEDNVSKASSTLNLMGTLLKKQGDMEAALDYFNQVRTRAYGTAAGNITDAELTLQEILDERARELYWECHRRTDLIRYGQFSESSYLWAWKGGVKEGISVNSKFDIYPIPSADLSANPNLVQNPGYLE